MKNDVKEIVEFLGKLESFTELQLFILGMRKLLVKKDPGLAFGTLISALEKR